MFAKSITLRMDILSYFSNCVFLLIKTIEVHATIHGIQALVLVLAFFTLLSKASAFEWGGK